MSWSLGLPAWQSDAIARLFVKRILPPEDLDDLYALLKAAHGIPDLKGRVANRLSADKVSPASIANVDIKLLAVKNLRNVNAIAEKQRLAFGATGLTIVYGDNGSGKSGYSRVLKRACRARDQNEQIHPNANLPPNKTGIAQAEFELSTNGVESEVTWVNGTTAPPALSSLAIFDSHCARAYLDDEDDFAYVPYGLDILEGLAQTCKQLDTLSRNEYAQNQPDTSAFSDLGNDETKAGKLIASLSAKTKPEQVEALATISAEENGRREELDKALKTHNPKERAAQLRLRAARLMKLDKTILEKHALVNSVALARIRNLAEAFQKDNAVSELAAKILTEDESLLPGTGGDLWKELFESARKFCTKAHPNKVFPDLGSDGKCPLCQQLLSDGNERLIRFDKFVQDEAEKKAKASKSALAEERKVLFSQNVDVGFDDALFSEVEAIDEKMAANIREFEKSLLARYTGIKGACASLKWDALPEDPECPTKAIQVLIARTSQEATDLEKITDEKLKAAMDAELAELDARLRLSKVKTAVLWAITKYDIQGKLNKCLGAVKTTTISLKTTELAEKVISKELAEALNSEFKELGASGLSVSLQSRSAKGKALHKLKLDFLQSKNLGDILSEGEQRAIAIGSFLAEVNLGGGAGGIVFDDPVSSLDHKRRERVASRLVKEGKKRQIIIFTHDIYFVCVLMEEANQSGVPCITQSLARRPEGYGVADPALPFEGLGTKDRVASLRGAHPQIVKLYKDGDESEHRKRTVDAYRLLRISWERAIEEVLFRNVVVRFRKGVSTQPLAGVVVDDNDYVQIEAAMTKCSTYAHDQALLGGTQIPHPDELLADINALEDWRLKAVKRGVEVQKKRTGS